MKRKLVLILVTVLVALLAGVSSPRPERLVMFDRLLVLAVSADAAYDALDPEWTAEPQTWAEVRELVEEIVYQIAEEGASDQLVLPTDLRFIDYGPGRRSAVAGTYYPSIGSIALNKRFLTPAWGDHSWLAVLIHELVHAQGYIVGDSSALESQTEIIATEVTAAMANLNYPGAQAEVLDGLRRDALAVAYFIARFGGEPDHSTYSEGQWTGQANAALLDRLSQVRAQVFSPTELARVEKRLRWWDERPDEYAGVLSRYYSKVVTMLLDAACGTGVMAEGFMQRRFQPRPGGGYLIEMSGDYEMPPLLVDDLAYILRKELGFC